MAYIKGIIYVKYMLSNNSTLKINFGSKVREYRIAKKLNQEKFAEIIGITQQTLSGIENGRYFPSYKVLVNIINALEVNPKNLFTYCDEAGVSYIEDFKELCSSKLAILSPKKRITALNLIDCLIKEEQSD